MNPQIRNILGVLEDASKGKLILAQAQQQIENIAVDSSASEIKSQSLRLLSKARREQESAASLRPTERLKVARRTGAALQDATNALKEQAASIL